MTDIDHVNEVSLAGRLSGEPEWRALPSGDRIAVWRLVVRHGGARSPQDAIDTVRCVAFDASLHDGVRAWRHGDVIEVRGALRHRFWRGRCGPRGVYEVEAETAALRLRADLPEGPGAPPGRRGSPRTPGRA